MTLQREAVGVLRGTREPVNGIEGVLFKLKSLDRLEKKAPLIAFHYHALTLYIYLLLNKQGNAMREIEKCRETFYAAEGAFAFAVDDIQGC